MFVRLLVLASLCSACLSFNGQQRNLFNQVLEPCSFSPMTGWFRDGYCRTNYWDYGVHTVCSTMTQEFLDYTRNQGNDLSTPRGSFPGLRPGDRWCLCALRWRQAFNAGKAPLVKLSATQRKTLQHNSMDILRSQDDQRLYQP